jgi:iron complex outermembrane recepter protein
MRLIAWMPAGIFIALVATGRVRADDAPSTQPLGPYKSIENSQQLIPLASPSPATSTPLVPPIVDLPRQEAPPGSISLHPVPLKNTTEEAPLRTNDQDISLERPDPIVANAIDHREPISPSVLNVDANGLMISTENPADSSTIDDSKHISDVPIPSVQIADSSETNPQSIMVQLQSATSLKPVDRLASFESTSVPGPTQDEQLWINLPRSLEADIVIDHGVFRAAMQQPLAPLQPLQPVQPPSITPYEPSIPGAFETLGTTSIAALAAAVGGGPAQGVTQAQAQSLASNDIGGLLQSANTVQSVNTTRRSPVALAPNVRGYEFGQIYAQANGAYWFPVREDLDSMLNKIDPGMIQDVIVIPGPYGLRYGPGLSFIDIVTQDTPRYDDGSESSYRANGDLHTNGGQIYGRLTVEGGDDDYGYRISYGHRKGSDYEAGNDLSIPSSYDTGDVWAQFGYSPSKYERIEASFLRLDQDNVEYAAQFFDVDTLGTFGTTLKFIDEDPGSPWTQLKLEGWWNRTQFTGSITPNKRDPNFPVITRVEFALDQEEGGTNTLNGTTQGDNVASGARAVTLYGDLDDQYLRTGVDFHFLEQGTQENYVITSVGSALPPISAFSTNQPFGQLSDGGFFSEYCLPIADGWKLTLGGRADWVNTSADPNQLRSNTNLDPDELAQSDVLYSYYATNEFKFSDEWKLNFGYGYAQRPPTLTERYADGVFLGLLQSGFTRVIGDPTLKPERDFQLDLGLTASYDNFHAGVSGFYAFVDNYITFEGDAVANFLDAKLVNFVNTPLATLTGFEASADFDWSSTLTPFAKAKYVQGDNQTLRAPLPAIPPLEGTLGLRWHDSSRAQKWEVEVGQRMVTRQDRPGAIVLNGAPEVVEEATPGFATTYIHTTYNWTKNLSLVAGIDNIFNRIYQEQLDLRLLGPTGFPAPPTRVLSPGISPFFGFDWTF